jgi:hypothetical protein
MTICPHITSTAGYDVCGIGNHRHMHWRGLSLSQGKAKLKHDVVRVVSQSRTTTLSQSGLLARSLRRVRRRRPSFALRWPRHKELMQCASLGPVSSLENCHSFILRYVLEMRSEYVVMIHSPIVANFTHREALACAFLGAITVKCEGHRCDSAHLGPRANDPSARATTRCRIFFRVVARDAT